MISNAAGDIELVSARTEATFGYARAELLGRPARMLFGDAVLRRAADPTLAGRATTLDCKRKTGASFPAEITASPIQLDDEAHVIVVARDVSERRAMEHQLDQSQRMESLGQLTGGVAHDFNNLLGVIVGNLDLVERHVQHDDAALARLHTAQRAAMRGADLTRRLLAFARCQQLDPRPTSANQLITELLVILSHTLGPEIEISTMLAHDLPDALVDAPGLEGALLNLALNARDAMASGGQLSIMTSAVTLDDDYAPVLAGELAPGRYVRIAISDTGQGMTPATIARVFEPFFTTKPRGKGTGLGLAMVYGFVKQSRGDIRIYSELGIGTTFTLDVPVATEGAPLRAAPAAAVQPIVRPGDGPLTALVVDDEPDLLEVAVTYCEELGFRVVHASDGMSALETAVQQPRVDLLVTDIVMPGGLSGVALAACLRPQYPELRVVYCSGFPSSALAERSALHVDAPLINKPYLKDVFIHTVRDALARPVGGAPIDPPSTRSTI